MMKGLLFTVAVMLSGTCFAQVPVQGDTTADADKVFTSVEVQPEFHGGWEGLMQYLINNVTYPVDARRAGTEGKIFVAFIIERDGAVSNVSIVKGVSKSLDKEAMRVVRQMPKWKPGMTDERLVRTRFVLPINFALAPAKNSRGK